MMLCQEGLPTLDSVEFDGARVTERKCMNDQCGNESKQKEIGDDSKKQIQCYAPSLHELLLLKFNSAELKFHASVSMQKCDFKAATRFASDIIHRS